MRTISSTLRAAATSWQGIPSVSATIRDDRLRWSALHSGSGAANRTDQVVTDTAGGTVIARVMSNAAGDIKIARVTDPETAAQWSTWTTINAGSPASAHSDVALAEFSSQKLRVFYLEDNPGGGYDLICQESDDAGATWGNEHTVLSGLDPAPRLAAAHDLLFILQTQVMAYRESTWGDTSWSGPQTWAAETFGDAQGIGAAYDETEEEYAVIVAADGHIVTTIYAPTTWGSAYEFGPGADQQPPGASEPFDPSVTLAEDRYLVCWLDKHTGSPHSWVTPLVSSSADFVHFGNALPLDMPAATDRRVALCTDSTTHKTYAANENTVALCHYDPSASGVTPAHLARYRRECAVGRVSTLRLTLLDSEAIYRGLGRAGTAAEQFKALAKVTLSRGYITTSGAERVALDLYYIVGVCRTEGRDGGRVILGCVDGWGLLAMWTPQQSLIWTDRSIAWLLTELCARLGLGYNDDGHTGLTQVLPTFSLHPNQSARDGVRALLRLSRSVARFDVNGDLYALRWPETSPTTADVGASDEILEGAYGLRRVDLTGVLVTGDGAASRGDNEADAMALGLGLAEHIEDYQISNSAVAIRVRDRQLQLATQSARRETVLIPARPDLELWDTINLYAPTEAVPATDRQRTVRAITEEWQGSEGRYVTRLELAGA